MELYRNDSAGYMASQGWVSSGGLAPLVPNYISKISDDPAYVNSTQAYMYYRKDYTGVSCMTLNDADKYAFYGKLENPSTADLATMSDSFDTCVKTNWGMNYRVGN